MTFSTAFAFNDVGQEQAEAVSSLQARGVVSGIDAEHFAPKEKVSYGQSVQMIVKALNLNLDTIRFVKQPLATDYYTHVANDAWYADAFIIAHYNGLEIPKDANPHAAITREQFGDLLIRALEKKGNFPMIKMYININDNDQINPLYQGEMQRLLLFKITALDSGGNFNPKQELTRGEAATWVYNASQIVDKFAQKPPAAVEQVAVTVEKVTDDVNKVTLTREEKPNAGYGIAITGIRFGQDGQAVVTYTLTNPDPDSMNAAVITKAAASAYIASNYKAVAEPDASASGSN
ncbi:protease complex subunit PrcB family protein [Paenibacillus thalictri]|uniref:Protease complex subunit PrcB family protein n=2 Tax=Paenibacillus thalictri TaxID=2527873 RepID=A0A4Q9DV87_9BACL|nr:protease complex subunit PrcB family protein [Paenibacillus thalictri]